MNDEYIEAVNVLQLTNWVIEEEVDCFFISSQDGLSQSIIMSIMVVQVLKLRFQKIMANLDLFVKKKNEEAANRGAQCVSGQSNIRVDHECG